MEYVTKFINHPAFKTFYRAFIPVVLALFIADGADIFAVSLEDLRVWLAAGLAAVGAVALKAIDPTEPEYGRVRDSEGFEILPDEGE